MSRLTPAYSFHLKFALLSIFNKNPLIHRQSLCSMLWWMMVTKRSIKEINVFIHFWSKHCYDVSMAQAPVYQVSPSEWRAENEWGWKLAMTITLCTLLSSTPILWTTFNESIPLCILVYAYSWHLLAMSITSASMHAVHSFMSRPDEPMPWSSLDGLHFISYHPTKEQTDCLSEAAQAEKAFK